MEQLKNGQKVVFTIKDKNYKYEVCKSFLHEENAYNDKIFIALKLNKVTFADSAYGYTSDKGNWPVSKHGDYKALTCLVEALFPYCDKVTVDGKIVYFSPEKSIPKEPESSISSFKSESSDIIDFESIVKSQTIKLVFI